MADTTDYTGRITSEHSDKPKYMAMVDATVQPFVDALSVSKGLPVDFDLDSAVGVQLDQVGLWIGIGRRINTPLTGVYFSFDTEGLGFNQGVWKGPFDPDTGVIELDDETYRLLLRAKIAANHWDGTMETSKAILDAVFNPDGGSEFIEVSANNETFAVGDGASTAFQLRYQGQAVYATSSLTIYRTDWQGLQKLYTTPRTNLTFRSNDFANAAWNKSNTSVAAGVVLAPNGTPATRLTEAATSADHIVTQAGKPVAGNTKYCRSVFAKADSANRFLVLNTAAFGNWVVTGTVTYDLVNGVVVSGGAGLDGVGLEAYPDGWFRCWLASTTVAAPAAVPMSIFISQGGGTNYLGDGTSGIYIFGSQFEPGDSPTPYIETAAAAVTVTDYTIQPFNNIVLPAPLLAGAQLSWSGEGTAYAAGTYAFIEDSQDMSMTIGIAGTIPSAIALALISGGYISLKPSGAQVNYIATSVDNAPLFGFDVDNGVMSGFDKGAWGTSL